MHVVPSNGRKDWANDSFSLNVCECAHFSEVLIEECNKNTAYFRSDHSIPIQLNCVPVSFALIMLDFVFRFGKYENQEHSYPTPSFPIKVCIIKQVARTSRKNTTKN